MSKLAEFWSTPLQPEPVERVETRSRSQERPGGQPLTGPPAEWRCASLMVVHRLWTFTSFLSRSTISRADLNEPWIRTIVSHSLVGSLLLLLLFSILRGLINVRESAFTVLSGKFCQERSSIIYTRRIFVDELYEVNHAQEIFQFLNR